MPSGLLARIAAGDRAAVEECLDQYGDLVWALANRYLSNRAEAEEMVQEIFIDLWQKAGRFDEQVAAERTFVTMIAHRRLIDRKRKLRRTVQASPLPPDPVLPQAMGTDALVFQEEVNQARELMSELRPIEQKVIGMAIEEDLTQSQIAEILQMPLGTVKSIARRGLTKLRELLRLAPRVFVNEIDE